MGIKPGLFTHKPCLLTIRPLWLTRIAGFVGFNTVPHQQPQSQILSRLLQVMPWIFLRLFFFFRVETATDFIMLVSYFVCFLLVGSQVYSIFTIGDSTIGVCTTATHGRHMCLLVLVHVPCQGYSVQLVPPPLWVGVAS